ncbi:UDP-N-acetylenolpyruvoylglucosamine reductase [Candidatus Uhrbacteria bacterium CG_4_10_14_0_8_um_filter_58_22]|uniref:UDP-N-acetylenolpyruvoylglucosamine reductase n=1 Tax=Candidatus Uhrbacteria bacterium CG_4_10_14_0_8_um_filter_58_22 TaxID=1975029 RepID=A0A2M7QAW4_9BACT|nr:MAG: UDP-N-acetylenolpyruvoylglucosamine reductase [Parcubacteria group bacterium CG1_02_58_44]PIY63307.1 MAG: UDP-N-acetylenolpyruvoylglucosamine reductase [Candidatus Uhrbacteria bacterium CG_4_10_14_0_8_um_filter_58_22]
MSNQITEELRRRVSPEVITDEPLAPYTNYRIGGPADYLFAAPSADLAVAAVRTALELDLPYYILGGGSNVLVSDGGFRGLVIRMANRGIEIDGSRVRVEAGTPTALLSLKTTEAGLTGFEWAIGLPGTVGGAIRGNAGCYGGSAGEFVDVVSCLRDGKAVEMTRAECGFGYRQSAFKSDPSRVVLSVVMTLRIAEDAADGLARLKEILNDKRSTQPAGQSTAGCVFKNWRPESPEDLDGLRRWLDLDSGETVPVTADGIVPAGWILDRAQLKGTKVGHVSVSDRHANFFISDGQASAEEVVQLIALVKSRLRSQTQGRVILLEEIEYVGF